MNEINADKVQIIGGKIFGYEETYFMATVNFINGKNEVEGKILAKKSNDAFLLSHFNENTLQLKKISKELIISE